MRRPNREGQCGRREAQRHSGQIAATISRTGSGIEVGSAPGCWGSEAARARLNAPLAPSAVGAAAEAHPSRDADCVKSNSSSSVRSDPVVYRCRWSPRGSEYRSTPCSARASRPWLGVVTSSRPGDEHPSHLREPARRVGHVLDHLAGPHQVERAVLQGQRPVDRRKLEVQLRVAAAGSAQRRFGDVEAERARAGTGEHGRQVALPAAEVQHAITWVHVRQGEGGPERKVGGLELIGQPLPELLVVVAHRGNLTAPVTGSRMAFPPCPDPAGHHLPWSHPWPAARRESVPACPEVQAHGVSQRFVQLAQRSSCREASWELVDLRPEAPSLPVDNDCDLHG